MSREAEAGPRCRVKLLTLLLPAWKWHTGVSVVWSCGTWTVKKTRVEFISRSINLLVPGSDQATLRMAAAQSNIPPPPEEDGPARRRGATQLLQQKHSSLVLWRQKPRLPASVEPPGWSYLLSRPQPRPLALACSRRGAAPPSIQSLGCRKLREDRSCRQPSCWQPFGSGCSAGKPRAVEPVLRRQARQQLFLARSFKLGGMEACHVPRAALAPRSGSQQLLILLRTALP